MIRIRIEQIGNPFAKTVEWPAVPRIGEWVDLDQVRGAVKVVIWDNDGIVVRLEPAR